jgi:fatty-acyl-CoA synthase
MNLLQAFERTARCHPDDTALVAEDGREFTYGEFGRRSTRLANALEDRIPGERCATLALTGTPAVESMIAGDKRGVATVQLSFRASEGELVEMADAAEARGLLFDDANAEAALSLLDRGAFETAIHTGTKSIDRDDVEPYEAVLESASAEQNPALPRGDECAVLYTSGTTSSPKAAVFDQEQLWYGAVQGIMEHGIEHSDVAVVCTPWYHMVTTAAWIYPHVAAGATMVMRSTFDPVSVLETVDAHDATGLLAVPTQLDAVNEVQSEADYDVSTLEYVRTGGSIVSEALVERTSELLTDQLYNTYGMTEAGPNLTFAHPDWQGDHPGTVGKDAHSYELRVVETVPLDDTPDPEATVGPGGQGEVIARGPGMADGYIDNEKAEEKSFFDGWLRTCDVARVDDDGFLYIVDRVDNVIMSGGEKVYPAEVERTLESHEPVEESCVVGVEDDHWGEVVTAVVVARGVDAADLDDYCAADDSLADFKRPRKYVVADEALPRTDTGTLKREEIAEKHLG